MIFPHFLYALHYGTGNPRFGVDSVLGVRVKFSIFNHELGYPMLLKLLDITDLQNKQKIF